MRDLTHREREVLKLSGELYNKAISLPPVHANDCQDITRHITAIQNIIHARPSVENELGGTKSQVEKSVSRDYREITT